MKAVYKTGELTKKKILTAARTLFAQYGYDKTTTRDIAKQAGQRQSAISYHFVSKENLYDAVIISVVDSIMGAIQWYPEVIEDQDVALEAFVKFMRNFVRNSNSKEAYINGMIILREQYYPSKLFYKLTKNIIEPLQEQIAFLLACSVGKPELKNTDEFILHAHAIHSAALSFRIFQATLESRNDEHLRDVAKLEETVVTYVVALVKELRSAG